MPKTHCKRGHEYTDANTIWNKQPGGRRTRKCRACANSVHRSPELKARARDARKTKNQSVRLATLRERVRLMEHVEMERHFYDRNAETGSGFQETRS